MPVFADLEKEASATGRAALAKLGQDVVLALDAWARLRRPWPPLRAMGRRRRGASAICWKSSGALSSAMYR
ncbi:MAG: hypothetical protein WDN69_13460 [Aliidongia sp.]